MATKDVVEELKRIDPEIINEIFPQITKKMKDEWNKKKKSNLTSCD